MYAENDNIFEKITKGFYALTPSEKKIADYILNHRSEAQKLSITELADVCGVADATVTRFSRRLEYKGYNDLRMAIAVASSMQENAASLSGTEENVMSELFRSVYEENAAALRETTNVLDESAVRKTADILIGARMVLCMGQGSSVSVAVEAASILNTTSSKFCAVTDSHLQAVAATGMEKEDVLLFFSYSGTTRDLMDAMTLARERGAKVILVTCFPNCPGASMADVVLRWNVGTNPMSMGSVSGKIAQLYLVDILYTEICRRDKERFHRRQERMTSAIKDKHL